MRAISAPYSNITIKLFKKQITCKLMVLSLSLKSFALFSWVNNIGLHRKFIVCIRFQQYVTVYDYTLVVKIPDCVPLDVACLLPCSGLTSYSAVCSVKDSITEAIRIKGEVKIIITV